VKNFYKKVKSYFWAKQSHGLIFSRIERYSKLTFSFFRESTLGLAATGLAATGLALGLLT
jgi:hypothetical protein